MTSDSENKGPGDDRGEGEDVLNEYDQIQERLGEGFADDPRLESGVPPDQRGSDVEFIQMSGLVRPSAPPPAPAHDDLDSSRPVSFFEKGVADVDSEMVPGTVEDRSTANEEIRPVEQTRAAMSHLRDIIADLTKDTPSAGTDPELLAKLDAPEAPAEPAAEAPRPMPEMPSRTYPDMMAKLDAPQAPAEAPHPLPEAPVVSGEGSVTLDDLVAEFDLPHPMQSDTRPVIEPSTRIEAEVPEPPAEIRLEPMAQPPATETAAHAPAPVEEPVLVRSAPILPGHSEQLAEAERLLDELEPAPLAEFEASADPSFALTPPVSRARPVEADELPDEALDYKRQGKRRHRSPGKHSIARRLARLAAGLLLVSALAVATYTGYLWIQQRMASPQQLFNHASRLAARGDYAAASRLFEDFASLHPNDPMRPEAQFSAAFTMQLIDPTGDDERQQVTKQALRLFEQYRKDNPAHAKVARAESIMGRLNYESGRYAEAVELLRNPELRLRDPASTVPSLRTLARASAKMGDAEAARSYYLQAVGVQGNFSPDVDYAELGSLYQSRADRAEDLDKRIELQQLAIESWTHALEVPGIDPTSKQTIRSQLDVLRERLQSEPGMAPAMESLDVADSLNDEVAVVDAPAAPGGVVGPETEMTATAPGAHETSGGPAMEQQAPASEAHDLAPGAPAAPSGPERQAFSGADEHTATEDGEYVVNAGDTLASVAGAHHTSVEELKELNALKGDTIFEGQHLLVPMGAP